MVTVYIWDFVGKHEAWGHASMLVNDQTYISWWPEIPGQVPSPIHRNVYSSQPYRNRGFADDVRDEKHAPDHTINIEGLNESAIKDWWARFGLVRDRHLLVGPLLPWSSLSQNCSTIVATALTVGGGDKYAGWWKSRNIVWTPAKVHVYANAIRMSIFRQRRR